MNPIHRALMPVLFGLALTTWAQVANPSPAANTDWQDLQAPTYPIPAGGPALTTNQEILLLQQRAHKANSFYKAYPSDSRASIARKIEALSNLQEVQLGARDVQASAVSIGAAFVADTAQSLQDRFDVSLAMALVSQADSLQGKDPAANGAAYEAIADALYAEFGDVAAAYNYYLSLTISANNATAFRIATKIQAMNAPSWAKAQAQVVLNRASLVGKPVQLTLTTTDNQSIDLSQPSGKPTVVYIWGGAASMSDLAVLNSIKADVSAGARWIYVALNTPSPSLVTVQANAPIPGIQCFDPVNFAGWVPQILFLQVTPYAYVFDANGNLSGYGRPVDIPALLSAAGL